MLPSLKPPRLHRLMYGLLYPAVLGTVIMGFLPPLLNLALTVVTQGIRAIPAWALAKLVLTLGIVLHFTVDYVLAQDAPNYGWGGFVLEIGILLTLWMAASAVQLSSPTAPTVAYVSLALAVTYVFFLIYLYRAWSDLDLRWPVLTVEILALVWFVVGAACLRNWIFAAAGLFVWGALLAFAANRALQRAGEAARR